MGTRDQAIEKPQSIRFDASEHRDRHPQEYYDEIKARFAAERELRLAYRPPGTTLYTSEPDGELAHVVVDDPYAPAPEPREAITDHVEVLFIGGGFSALLTSARLRERGVESIRIVERGADVGGTWYWNRYPGIACDVVSYDYLPLLDEMQYVPSKHYAEGPEIFAHCQAIARRYDLYELAVFQTTVTSTIWDSEAQHWVVTTDRGDRMTATFVICANGTLAKPRLAVIDGMETFEGASFHTSRWDYELTGPNLEHLHDKVVGIIGTGASAVQVVPNLGATAKELYVFQRTPSSIDVRDDWPTDPEWAARRPPDWQAKRRAKIIAKERATAEKNKSLRNGITREEKIRRQENANIDAMMRIHRRIDETVEDTTTAEALKPWYMIMCKRPCFHNDYLPTFNRPNVHLVDTHGEGITKIGPKGPEFHGKTYELDVLIYATGFEVQQTGIYNRIVGEGGARAQREVRRRHPHDARHPHPRLPEPVHHGRLPGVVPVQPDRPAAGPGRPHRQLHRPRPAQRLRHDRREGRLRGVVGAGGHRQPRQDEPQHGVHARLLQLRGPGEPPPGRQLQRRLRGVHRPHRGGRGRPGGPLRVHLGLTETVGG